MATEIQLDIFEEAAKDTTAQRIKEEEKKYKIARDSILRDIVSTENALNDSDIPWNDRKEYEYDLQEYERNLKDLDESHQKTMAELHGRRR